MQVGLITDSVGHLPFEGALDLAQSLSLSSVEVATGNWSEAPHADLPELVSSATARDEFAGKISSRGLTLSALNANGNSLHPVEGALHDKVVRDTIELANQLGVTTVVMMSGLPGARGDSTPNWVTTSWPPETLRVLDYQWTEVAIPYWKQLAAFARDRGVRLAIEACGGQLVYNVTTMLRLIDAVGDDVVGANLDPSHLMWMGADIPTVIQTLGRATTTSTPRTSKCNDRKRTETACSTPCPSLRPSSAPGTTSPSAWDTPPAPPSGPTSFTPLGVSATTAL
jgi:sugar phosphate isomerase/epimerase